MKMTTRTRYALRALIDIGVNMPVGPVFLKDICARQDLSMKYLDRIITMLKVAGFARNAAGGSSGYVLAKQPKEIKVLDIVRVMENDFYPVKCADPHYKCPRESGCAASDVWQRLNDYSEKALDVGLDSLIMKQKSSARRSPVKEKK